jgi:hypothetical protein
VEANPDLLAPCGLYCGVCGLFYATRDDNPVFLEKLLGFYRGRIPGMERVGKEDLRCQGCLSETVSVFCRVCPVKNCTREKGYAGCHQCDDFPCRFIEEFPIPVGKKVILRAVPHWREHGTERWAADEEARYLCPRCGHQLFRGAKRCNRCEAAVDLD